jgi:hypothetical protein
MRYLYALILTALLSTPTLAQAPSRLKDPTVNFSVHGGAIFPSRLFRVRTNEEVFEGITYGIAPRVGYQIGGLAAFRLSEKFQVHAGITLLNRSYEGSADNGQERYTLPLRTSLYEIPAQIVYYQRLSNQFLLSVGTGVNIQSLPSNLRVRDGLLDIFARKRAFAVPGVLTTAGVEFRKQGQGGFFTGISYLITPFPLYDTGFKANFGAEDKFFVLPHIGDYFCLVVRYYLD